MPGPAVTVAVIITSVAALFAFKEFVYEPHLAPKLERWAEQYVARRRARRRMKEGPIPVPIPINVNLRRSTGVSKRSDDGSDGGSLEHLVAKEVDEWRTQVDGSVGMSQLRYRKNVSGSGVTLDESNASIPYNPIAPTQPSRNISSPSTPTARSALSPPPKMSTTVTPALPISRSSTLRSSQPEQHTLHSTQPASPIVVSFPPSFLPHPPSDVFPGSPLALSESDFLSDAGTDLDVLSVSDNAEQSGSESSWTSVHQ